MKKILSSLMLLALVVGLVGAGTIATFYDTETSNFNTMAAGTLDLGLANIANQDPRNDVNDTWDITAWAPGATFSNTLFVNNEGSIPASKLLLTFAASAPTEGTPTTVDNHTGPAVLADEISIKNATFGGVDVAALEGRTLTQLLNIPVPGTDLGPLAANTEKALFIEWEFDDDAANSLQGDSITVTVTLRAEQ